MNHNLLQLKNSLMVLLFLSAFSVIITGCSDDKKPQVQTQAKTKSVAKSTKHKFDHTHGDEVSDLDKHKFEHDFAEQCVSRELQQSNNKSNDRKRFEKPCMCIAQYMMKDLTAVEAEKFIKEHKNTQSLRIRFENAAFHCLQQKARPKGPKLFGR